MSFHVIERPEGFDEDAADVFPTPDTLPDDEKQRIISSLGNDLQRGDIIGFRNTIGYRNDGKSIFDGQDIISLYHELDDYGSVPPTFFVGDEFHPNTWSRYIVVAGDGTVFYDDAAREYSAQFMGQRYNEGEILYEGTLIDHNLLVWIDTLKYRKELIGNIRRPENKYAYTYFDGDLGRFYIETDDLDNFLNALISNEPLPVDTQYPGSTTVGGEQVLYYPNIGDIYDHMTNFPTQ